MSLPQQTPNSPTQSARLGFTDILLNENSTSRLTPDIANAMNDQLTMDTSEDDRDSLTSEVTSMDEEDDGKEIAHAPISSLPTGLCYDERMRYHSEVEASSIDSVHPEDPRRIYYIYKMLCQAGLVAEDNGRPLPTAVPQPLLRIDAREATREECLLIHTPAHYNFVQQTANMTNEELIDLSERHDMDSIYFNKLSYFSAKLSAGAAIDTCRAVMNRTVKNAIAVIRPPGHHAEVQSTMGFCLFNNVCIASRVCQADFGIDCRKILIVDWDVHHGNGCQKAFYNDPNILYISIHVHMDGKFYPSGDEGDMYHCGEGPGLGMNVNIPWPSKGMGDGDYMFAFQQIVMPIATEFDPDFVVVAAGFDAAAGDELGGCFVSPACYAHMTHMLKSLANGKIAVCLEGGYNVRSISISALAVTRTLMGEPPDRLQPTAATLSAVATVQSVKAVQSRYWRSLYPKEAVAGMYGGERLHDIIREWQAKHLYDEYRFTNLHVFRDQISKSFENQVLATPNYDDKENLLVIFHDAPDLLAYPNPITSQYNLHDTWLVDGVQSYIHWAVSHSFGVIDVTIPAHITDDPDATHRDPTRPNSTPGSKEPFNPTYLDPSYASTFNPADPLSVAKKESEKLALYLWDNYIEPSADKHVFLIGAGHAFSGIAKLLSEKDEAVHALVSGCITFIANNPVRGVKPTNKESPSYDPDWYRRNSLVYVSHTHNMWARGDKKISKAYGKVISSEETGLNAMMKRHEKEVCEFIAQRAGLTLSDDEASDAEAWVDEEEEGKLKESPLGGQAKGDVEMSVVS